MAKYGTILIIYAQDSDAITTVDEVLDSYSIPYTQKENSYYFKTLSKNNRDKITKNLRDKELLFILFHNNNSDGDRIKSGNLPRTFTKAVKSHIIEE